MEHSKEYKQLTGVDIEAQKRLWDERGKGYYGEYLVFSELFDAIPGRGKIIMNLQIPGSYGNTTELDLVFIHETGVYVFEIKHYKGTIYGKTEDEKWTQYFRTTPNQRFYNPVRQNSGHVKALSDLLGDAAVYSIVVFTNPEVDLRITNNDKNVEICMLSSLTNTFMSLVKDRKQINSPDKINNTFIKLLSYAPVMTKRVTVEGTEVPFYQYLDTIREDNKKRIESIEQEMNSSKRKHLLSCGVAAIVIAVAAIAVSFGRVGIANKKAAEAEKQRDQAVSELEDMKHNFESVARFNIAEQGLPEGFLTASDVKIANSVDVANSVELYAAITVKNNNYGVRFTDTTSLIVKQNNGLVKEYNLFGNTTNGNGILKNHSYYNYTIQLGSIYKKEVLSDLSADEIEYIKMKGIALCEYPSGRILRNDLELELYRY